MTAATIARALVALAAALALRVPAASPAEPLPSPQRISASAWAWIGPLGPPTKDNAGFRMNLGFVAGAHSVAVIDSGYTEAMAAQMLRAIAAVTDKPVRYVINTNSQPHRFLGNAAFEQAGAISIAAAEAAERMHREGPQFAQTVEQTLGLAPGSVRLPGKPRRLIPEGAREVIDLGGGISLELQHLGTTHTRGSIVVAVRPDNVVFAGDILYGGRLPAVLPDGNLRGWLGAYGQLQRLDAKVFVPGHGKPGPLGDFDHATFAYLRALKAHADAEVKAGSSIEPAVNRFDARAWQSLENFSELARRNAYNAFLESEAEF